ncbi:uncharacterized protein [Tursiops truncatus]|uniref:uncharacterized protein n=1 Tax=Tursiops truncatus TaxID=9739 RepID=UPI003CCF5660
MGQTMTTPLSVTLSYWTEVRARAHKFSVEVKKGKWQTLCASEWPTFQIGWPPEGSFLLDKIKLLKSKIFNIDPHGHPDQVPYVLVWEDLILSPPPWFRPFVSSTGTSAHTSAASEILALKKNPNTEKLPDAPDLPKAIYPDPQSDLLLLDSPPPYPPAPNPLPPRGPPAPLPSAPREPSMMEEERGPSVGTRSRRAISPDSIALPLREYGPPDGQGNRPLQYWPFSSADLYNWKMHNPTFSENPQALTALIESLVFSHQPTWDDCQQLLQTLLTTEERQRVLLEARKNVLGANGQPTQLPNEIDAGFPLVRPNWDFNAPEGREHLKMYRQALVAGLHGAARRPTNLAKVREVTQGPHESLTVFLERLMEAFRRFTPYDPTSEGHRATIAMAFIDQAAPDIKKKLQRLDGLQGFSLQELVKEADKV